METEPVRLTAYKREHYVCTDAAAALLKAAQLLSDANCEHVCIQWQGQYITLRNDKK